MSNHVAKLKRLTVLPIVFFVVVQCTRDKSVNEPMPMLAFDYFPLKIGHTWSYHVNYNERISTSPFRNVWFTGAEHWTVIEKNDADSTLVFDISFVGKKIQLDTSGVADSIQDLSFSDRLSLFLHKGRITVFEDAESKVFFDDWLRNVEFRINFSDSSATSIQITSNGFSNARWTCTLERDVGMRSGEWTADYAFGSFHLEYLLFEED